MKIITLGTSHGDPTPNRFCSATLLECNDRHYLIDCGDGCNALLFRNQIQAAQLQGVFITHMHIDHCGGLPTVIEQAVKYRRKFPDIKPVWLIPDQEAVPVLGNWCQANSFTDGNTVDYTAGQCYRDPVLSVKATPTRHIKPPSHSYALTVKAEGKKIFFSGDLKDDFSDFPFEEAQNSDLMLCELTHFPIETALPVLKRLRIGHLVFNHLGDTWQSPEELRQLQQYCAELPYPAEPAEDGKRFII